MLPMFDIVDGDCSPWRLEFLRRSNDSFLIDVDVLMFLLHLESA